MNGTARGFVQSEVFSMRNFQLIKLDRSRLKYSIHVGIIHVVNLVRGTGGQNGDSLQNCDDELRV